MSDFAQRRCDGANSYQFAFLFCCHKSLRSTQMCIGQERRHTLLSFSRVFSYSACSPCQGPRTVLLCCQPPIVCICPHFETARPPCSLSAAPTARVEEGGRDQPRPSPPKSARTTVAHPRRASTLALVKGNPSSLGPTGDTDRPSGPATVATDTEPAFRRVEEPGSPGDTALRRRVEGEDKQEAIFSECLLDLVYESVYDAVQELLAALEHLAGGLKRSGHVSLHEWDDQIEVIIDFVMWPMEERDKMDWKQTVSRAVQGIKDRFLPLIEVGGAR